MPRRTAVIAVLISAAFFVFTQMALAIVELNEFHYDRPIRSIRGKVTGFGQVVPGFWVDVYKARVPLDYSASEFERTTEEARVASVEPNEKGEFNIQRLPKGFYEVRFGNRGQGGYDVVAVLVNIDPRGAKDKLCVGVGLEGSGPRSTVSKCGDSGKELKFCELLRNPKQYDGQVIKTRATLEYGFEWSLLSCLDCLDKGKAWLNTPGENDDLERAWKRLPKGAGIVNVTVVGTFHFGGSYGHLNMSRYEVVAREIRDIAVIQRGMKDAASERKVEQESGCGGSNPK